jgi:hypothetical protein
MTKTTTSHNSPLRIVAIVGLLVAAFFGAYRFASARSGQAAPAAAQTVAAANINSAAQAAPSSPAGGSQAPGAGSTGSAAAGGCACCNGGATAPTSDGVTGNPIVGTAQLAGGIQVIGVKVTTSYSPNVIQLKAGIPAEITFSQAAGCTGEVVSKDLGFAEDLSAGPRVVKLGALKKGTYSFSCGMGMVLGKIVVG